MEKMMKKCKSKRGFTLIEMLATVIVMLLVTEIISLSIQMSSKYYTQSVRSSESQTICGTLATAVQEELQYATKIQTVSGVAPDENGFYDQFTYYSRTRQHGSSSTLVCRDEDGRLYVSKGGKDYALVGSETYTYDLRAEMDCGWSKTEGCFQVDLRVKSKDDVLATENFRVYPLNEGF